MLLVLVCCGWSVHPELGESLIDSIGLIHKTARFRRSPGLPRWACEYTLKQQHSVIIGNVPANHGRPFHVRRYFFARRSTCLRIRLVVSIAEVDCLYHVTTAWTTFRKQIASRKTEHLTTGCYCKIGPLARLVVPNPNMKRCNHPHQ